MREMKDSGIEWIGQVPNNWKLKKGKYLFKQHNNRGNLKCLQLLSPSQKFGVIPQTLLEELTTQNVVKVSEKANLNDFKTVHVGDFCISLRSFQGGFEYSRYEGVVSPAYQIFSAIGDNLCDGYYRYLFKGKSFIDKMNSYTMTLRDGKNIAFDDFGNTYIPVPTKSEQEKIANFLDSKCSEIDAISADIQKEIEILEQYKRSVITEAVTKGLNPDVEMKDSSVEWVGIIPASWTSSRLGYETYIRARLGWKGLKADEYVDEGYAFISAFNIQNNKLVWTPLNYITKERYDESPEIKLHIGDVIIVKDGAGIGKCARIDSLPMGETAPNSSIGVITPLAKLNYRYLAYYLQSAIFNNLILKLLNGMGVPHLTQEVLNKTPILLPPKQEQVRIANFLDSKCCEIDSAIETKKKQIDILDAYKKSLIYEYVTGKKEVPVQN
jgi:type I restriction enzyme S subunit